MHIIKTQDEIAQERKNKHVLARTHYPIDKKLIILGRQSNAKQVIQNRESYEQQTVELLEKALDLSWNQEDVTILYENEYDKFGQKSEKPRDVSGNLSIDERPILKLIVDTIKGGGVGAVMFWDVSRLTRDIDVVDGPYFAKVCRDYDVIILTNDDEFDFNRRKDDIDKFVTLAIEAKNYRQNHIMKKVLPARERVARRGEFFGHSIPVGLMLDDARKFYISNPYWSPIAARLFKRYRELDGSFALFHREIYGRLLFPELNTIHFPDVPQTILDDILERIGRIQLSRVEGGYTIKGRTSLQMFLTNVAYIGHINYNGQLIKNTHPAIVNEEDFWFAFNRISNTDIEGNPIEREKRVVRYQQETDKERQQALLEGTRDNGNSVITSPERSVYVMRSETIDARYRARNLRAFELEEIVIKVLVVDALVEERLFSHVEDELNASDELSKEIAEQGVTLVQSFEVVDTQEQTPVTTPDSRIEEIERNIARLDREYNVTFDIMSDTDIRENRASKARLIKRLDDVKKAQEHTAQEQKDMQEAVDLVASGNLQEKWHKWKMEKKQKFIRLATQDIILERVADNWLTLTIKWRSWIQKEAPHRNILLVDTAYILRSSTWQAAWTPDEDDIIRALYPDTSRSDMLQCLPRRSWWSIRVHASSLSVLRQTRTNGSDIPFDLSVNDVAFLQKQHLSTENYPDNRVWWTCEMCNLDSAS